MLTIAICDDDENVRQEIKKTIEVLNDNVCINIYKDAKILNDKESLDIVFMDIEIGDESGIDFAMEIRATRPDCIIIFITSYTSYISDVFDTVPFQYLLKPVDKQRLINVFHKALSYISNRKKFIPILWNGVVETDECSNVVYLERYQRNVLLHLNDGNVKKSSKKFVEYISMLECHGFVRSHNSVLVNISYMRAIRQYTIILTSGEVVFISKKYLPSVREVFSKKISGEIICK